MERWPTEIPLLVVVAIAAGCLWLLFALSMIGLIYAVFIGLFLSLSHLGFVAYLRGSAVRLGPDQFPELHARVVHLAHRVGLRKEPEVYVMQAGGSLNALATGFLRSRMVVLFSDLRLFQRESLRSIRKSSKEERAPRSGSPGRWSAWPWRRSFSPVCPHSSCEA